MSDRIRQLEDALAILQSTLTREPHPLLDRELLKIKSSIELHSAIESETGTELNDDPTEDSQYIDAFGTLAVRDDGAATFYGRSAGSEVSVASVPTCCLKSGRWFPFLFSHYLREWWWRYGNRTEHFLIYTTSQLNVLLFFNRVY